MAWECKTLEECTEYITDGDHQPAPKSDEGVLFIKIKGIKENRIDFKEALHVPQVYYDGIQQNRKPVVGDTLYTVVGSYGLSAYVNFDIPFCFERNIALLHPQKNVDSRFLFYSVSSLDFFKQAENAANGAAQKLIPLSRLKKLKIQLPSLEIQKKIVDILSSYDNLIENNQKQIKLLEEAAQRLYKQWFIDLKFPGHETTKIVDGLPKGWKYRNVSDFGSVITGKTPSTSNKDFYGGDIPFVTISDMHGNVFSFETEKYLTSMGADSQKTKFLPKNAVMVSCIATVGLVNIVAKECQTNQQINSVILKEGTDVYFFYESMLLIKSLLDGVGSNGATMTNVNKSKFENVRVLYPTKNLVMKFHEFTHPLFLKILSLSKSIHELKLNRDRLLPKLMSGEIEV